MTSAEVHSPTWVLDERLTMTASSSHSCRTTKGALIQQARDGGGAVGICESLSNTACAASQLTAQVHAHASLQAASQQP